MLMHLLLNLSLIASSMLCSPDHKVEPAEPAPFQPKGEVNIALVLGGGGSKGLAHLGVIQSLEAAGIRPDLIVGCSAGAIAGAVYADEIDVGGATKRLIGLRRGDLLDFSFLRPLFGLIDGHALQSYFSYTLRAKTFDGLKIPLIAICTDLETGATIEIAHGNLAEAVRASCAFPGFFKPALVQGRYLIDGGASAPMPVSIARKYGAKTVIAVDVSEKLPKAGPRHLFGITKRSLEIAYRKFVEQSLEDADVVIRLDFENVGTFSDHLNEQLLEAGKAVGSQKVADIQRVVRLKTTADCHVQ